jgi:hypothetical protein
MLNIKPLICHEMRQNIDQVLFVKSLLTKLPMSTLIFLQAICLATVES